MENRNKHAHQLDKASVVIQGIYLLLFPVLVASITTDAYLIPKQAGIAFVVISGLVLMAARGILTKNVRLRRTPFDLPIVLLILAALLSSVFAVNRFDSLITFVPFMFAALFFFIITNTAKKQQDFKFLLGMLIGGGILVSAITLLSYLKIYLLPFSFAKVQTFTTFGSLFDQLMYLVLILAMALYMALPALKKKAVAEKGSLIFVGGAFVLLLGVVITAIAMFTLQKPVILPYQTGFQTAFAAISQDNGRVVQGFLMGSGLGTFLTDFTRFKPATFNASEALWNLSFLRSSTFALELIATTGLLGILSFLFLIYKIFRTKPLFTPLILAVVLAFILPFSYSSIMLFFVILALYSVSRGFGEHHNSNFFDVDLRLVTLRQGVFALTDPNSRTSSEHSNLLPVAFAVLVGVFTFVIGIVSVRFLASDYLFQKSLIYASKNDAQNTYKYQTDAIRMFPQRDGYHRIFSQINLAIANNLALSIPQGTQPTQEQQQTIYQLIQQAINSGRNASTVSPQTSVNWQNLSSIYRALIGFGQNADQFALLANQQAIILDPNNPQEYINYGGIYYQLGQWDNAIRQFQYAASLKPDFANAYYNLGHALEQKGDFQGALTQYQTVRQLVIKDKASVDVIDKEIAALQQKAANSQQANTQPSVNQGDLQVNQPQAQLPEQNPPVKIPGPTTSLTPSPSARPSVSPSPAR